VFRNQRTAHGVCLLLRKCESYSSADPKGSQPPASTSSASDLLTQQAQFSREIMASSRVVPHHHASVRHRVEKKLRFYCGAQRNWATKSEAIQDAPKPLETKVHLAGIRTHILRFLVSVLWQMMTEKHKRRGFTFAELIIVVLIIGIMAATAAPRFARSLSYYRAESAAKRIKADLGLARKHAMSTSSMQTVSFTVASDCYSLDGVSDLDHGSPVYEIDLSRSPYTVTVVSAEFDDAEDADVEFNGYGVPDSGGTVVVETGGFQRTIVLDPETGKASIQ